MKSSEIIIYLEIWDALRLLDGHIPTPNGSLAIQHFPEHVLFQAVYSQLCQLFPKRLARKWFLQIIPRASTTKVTTHNGVRYPCCVERRPFPTLIVEHRLVYPLWVERLLIWTQYVAFESYPLSHWTTVFSITALLTQFYHVIKPVLHWKICSSVCLQYY